MNLYDAITNRVSIRKYADKPVEVSILNQLKDDLKKLVPLDPNSTARLELISDTEIVKEIGIGFLGGRLKINAPHCIVGITSGEENCAQNVGFILEQAILNLGDKGISTIWLGTFSKEKIQSICHVKPNEKAIIVIAFGYAEKGFYNSGMRKLLSASKRKDITEIAFYKGWGNTVEPYLLNNQPMKKILSMSTRCPSGNNAQPVRVVLEEDRALFYIKINSKYETYKIDAGIFMAHFYLSCIEEALKPVICIDRLEHNNYNIPNDYTYIGAIQY